MRIATYAKDGKERLGIIVAEAILDLARARQRLSGAEGPETALDFLAAGQAALDEAAELVEKARAEDPSALFERLDTVRLLSPIPRPHKNIFCVGRNYKAHIEEGARARGAAPSYPEVPEFFTKPPTSVIGHDAEIRLDPRVTGKLDYEVELAFVIGQRCRDLAASDAERVIFGYTVLNDVTARDLQFSHGQWFKGKALDTFCPIGPWIVTTDEFGTPSGRRLSLRVNGETRQLSSTADMLFSCAEILESLSAGMTLEPGDIVTTGTPSGVGLGMSPQVWLADGDVIEAEIEGVGVLRNTVRAVG
ncbi:fumarylacetoacetate hydrolase family protein [Rhodoligotrophos defluvii]|uniref:fumarylacetoacetate hydrolase family protein n=1 Tax=Rhodoligotrophos defluvii TaxID=2561934 RepID=UPI0010C9C5AE|nr:fumarylacetoacetate hydrolase family protein [Rhodoligotrophos defluvii]